MVRMMTAAPRWRTRGLLKSIVGKRASPVASISPLLRRAPPFPVDPCRNEQQAKNENSRQNQECHDPDVRRGRDVEKTQYQKGHNQKAADSREGGSQKSDPVASKQRHQSSRTIHSNVVPLRLSFFKRQLPDAPR